LRRPYVGVLTADAGVFYENGEGVCQDAARAVALCRLLVFAY
jgi:hypothetical protein